MEADDDVPTLSADTLAVLQEFLQEKARAAEIEDSDDVFVSEDWQLSQFWYTEETSRVLAEEAVRESKGGSIVCVSAPSIFRALKKLQVPNKIVLLEFDTRFGQLYGDEFVFYDYKQPLDLPESTHNAFDFIVADPPFLAAECFSKLAQTLTLLANPSASILVSTGTVMRTFIVDVMSQRFGSFRRCQFAPKHEHNLGNDFSCFTSYESASLGLHADG
eukprot:TRINITY_DN22740_c0_g1_i1.p1 TRINITY_DN22740_c0_g1~~TRINITY_DN22740_c0_g1_i1.p1  ORF type:complete len:218 (-),score=71.13 TRINITY_DN22740_c0_g1_i1:19-672(-)